MPRSPACFVLMPFGVKKDPSGNDVNFDAVYQDLIAPGVRMAGMEPLRADEERVGGIIHKPMFERLLLCDYAIADLTTANPNVFYELGVRHAARPFSTVMIFADGMRLPFDVGPLRGLPYRLSPGGLPADPQGDARRLFDLLTEARKSAVDSPLYQLIDALKPPPIEHLRTDLFRDQVEYCGSVKERLAGARAARSVADVEKIEQELGPLDGAEAGVLIDLLLSYRALDAHARMIALAERLPAPIRSTVLVREQYAFALNRAGQGEKAERVLTELLRERGPSSETYGILGRVYKDRWAGAAKRQASVAELQGHLNRAIEAYLKGFDADIRDAYPGVNAATLMELREPPDPRREKVLPVVRYAVERKRAAGTPHYWDYATLVELAVLARDEAGARSALGDALACVEENWWPRSTAGNLRLIRETRERRGTADAWAKEVEDELNTRAQG